MNEERLPRPMLTDWKAIADYFSRNCRTVQRWEKEEGLPIHRHPHRRRNSVYAYVDELDAWWRQRDLPATSAIESHGPLVSSAGARALPVPGMWMRRSTLTGVALAGIGVVIALGVAVPLNTRSRPSVATEPNVMSVVDGSTTEAWLAAGPIADLNGDGTNDLVLSAVHAKEVSILFGGTQARSGQLPALANVTVRGSDNGQHTGSIAGDFNGDGLSDLLIGVVLYEPDTLRSTGAAYVVLGRREWPATLQLPADADWAIKFAGPKDVRMVPCASDKPLDLNRDGLDDVVLGAVDYSPANRTSAGGAFVLFGRREWPRVLDLERDADITIMGSRSGEGLSGACASGDVNGDGRPDLALLAREETLWALLGGRGRYYVFFGRDRWPRLLDAGTSADLTFGGPRPNAVLAPPVVADLNGDGIADLIGASSGGTSEQPGAGEIACFWGRRGQRAAVQPMEAADLLIRGDTPDAALGAAITAADLDADGIDDLLVVEGGQRRLHMLFGRHRWPSRASFADLTPHQLLHAAPGAGDGGLRVGDLDGDTLPEVVITSPFASVPGHGRSGRAWLVKPQRPIAADMHPDHTPNTVFRPGVLAIRISGAQVPSGDRIDAATACIGGVRPIHEIWRDFDGDGIDDLQLYFNTGEMAIGPTTGRLCITARTRRGTIVVGVDSVVVSPGAGDALDVQPDPANRAAPDRRRQEPADHDTASSPGRT